MRIVKRNGTEVQFNKTKIKQAIVKAMRNGSGIYLPDIARLISNDAERYFQRKDEVPTISLVEKYVYQRLIHYGQSETARAYEEFRAVQAFKRERNTTDESIIGLVRNMNDEVARENSNKNSRVASTQRDLIAGEVSKDISRRKLIPAYIVQAHDTGAIHYHDMDYAMQPIFNCCLVDIKDMLDNGTVINGKMVESPKSFQVACTVMTQVIAQIASGQYGGQTLNVKHLGKYLARSRNKYEKMFDCYYEGAELDAIVDKLLKKELEAGVQTIQYQINTLMTTNGQAPFVTLFLEIEPGHKYEKEISMIIEEIIRQRIVGIKNEVGVYVTPSFPKLVYVLDENNVHTTSKYRHITNLCIECSAKRLYPDYISAKKMKENYEGNIFGPMGKVS